MSCLTLWCALWIPGREMGSERYGTYKNQGPFLTNKAPRAPPHHHNSWSLCQRPLITPSQFSDSHILTAIEKERNTSTTTTGKTNPLCAHEKLFRNLFWLTIPCQTNSVSFPLPHRPWSIRNAKSVVLHFLARRQRTSSAFATVPSHDSHDSRPYATVAGQTMSHGLAVAPTDTWTIWARPSTTVINTSTAPINL